MVGLMLASVFFEEVGRGERIRAESRREARGGLKTSLRPDFERSEELVGARGFEPPTPRSRTECWVDDFRMFSWFLGLG